MVLSSCSKWLREAAKSRILCKELKNQGKSKEDQLETKQFVLGTPKNPLTKEAPLNSLIVFARPAPIQVSDTDPISDIPSSVLSDLSPQLAEQLNCPIFDLELGVQSPQNDLDYNMFGNPNETANISQMDYEQFQDLKSLCSPISTLPPQILTIDDEYGHLYADNMANLSKVSGFERIQDERSINIVQSDITQTIAINEQFFANSQYSVDNNVCVDGFLNANNAPDFETELELSYSPEWQENQLDDKDNTLQYINSNNYVNVPVQMYDPNATIEENDQFAVSCDTPTKYDYSQLNEDSLEKYQQPEDIPIITSQMKEEDNNQLIDDVLNVIFNNSANESVKKSTDLNLFCEIIPDDLLKGVPTTPELFDTLEQLEAEKEPLKLESNVNSNHPFWINSVKSNVSDLDYNTLTPPDTPLQKSTRKKRRNSEESDVTYVPPTKKPKSDLAAYSSNYKTKYSPKIESFEPRKKGRPLKIVEYANSPCSTITEDSNASPEDIERVKRERNNEASRRSRYNRKIKENEMAEYSVHLETQNNLLRKKSQQLDRKITKLKEFMRRKMLYG